MRFAVSNDMLSMDFKFINLAYIGIVFLGNALSYMPLIVLGIDNSYNHYLAYIAVLPLL